LTIFEIEIIIPTSNVEVTYFSPQTGSEQVPVGAQTLKDRSTNEVERFLSSIRFESKGKFDELGIEVEKKSIKSHRLNIAIKIE